MVMTTAMLFSCTPIIIPIVDIAVDTTSQVTVMICDVLVVVVMVTVTQAATDLTIVSAT